MHLFIHSKTNDQEMTSFCCLYAILRYYHYKHDFVYMLEDLQGQPFNFSSLIKLLDLYRVEYKYCFDLNDIFNLKGSIFLIHTTSGSLLYMGSFFKYVIYMDPLKGYCIKKKNDFLNMDILDVLDITFIGRYPFYHQSIYKIYAPFKPLLLKMSIFFIMSFVIFINLGPVLKIVFLYILMILGIFIFHQTFYKLLLRSIENENKYFIELLKLYNEGVKIRITLVYILFFETLGLVFLNRKFIPFYILQQLFCIIESVVLFKKREKKFETKDLDVKKIQIIEEVKYLYKYPMIHFMKYLVVLLHMLFILVYLKSPAYILLHLNMMGLLGIYKSMIYHQLYALTNKEQLYLISKYKNDKDMRLDKIESIKIYDLNQWNYIDNLYFYNGENLFCHIEKLKINDLSIKKYSICQIKKNIAYYRTFTLPLTNNVLEYFNEQELNALFYLQPIFNIQLLHQQIGSLNRSYQELLGFIKAYYRGETIIFFDHCFEYLTKPELNSIYEFIKTNKRCRVIISLEK